RAEAAARWRKISALANGVVFPASIIAWAYRSLDRFHSSVGPSTSAACEKSQGASHDGPDWAERETSRNCSVASGIFAAESNDLPCRYIDRRGSLKFGRTEIPQVSALRRHLRCARPLTPLITTGPLDACSKKAYTKSKGDPNCPSMPARLQLSSMSPVRTPAFSAWEFLDTSSTTKPLLN